MTTRDESLAAPILLCGMLGGMVGGLTCCCWVAPAFTSLWAVRWARNVRGPGVAVTSAGIRAALLSALLMATFGTAIFLYLNDPSRMSAEEQAMLKAFGGADVADLPLAALAAGHAAIAGSVGLGLGLLGALLGGGGAGAASRSRKRSAAAGPAPAATTAGEPASKPKGEWTPLGAPAPAPPAAPAEVPASVPAALPDDVEPVHADPKSEEAAWTDDE